MGLDERQLSILAALILCQSADSAAGAMATSTHLHQAALLKILQQKLSICLQSVLFPQTPLNIVTVPLLNQSIFAAFADLRALNTIHQEHLLATQWNAINNNNNNNNITETQQLSESPSKLVETLETNKLQQNFPQNPQHNNDNLLATLAAVAASREFVILNNNLTTTIASNSNNNCRKKSRHFSESENNILENNNYSNKIFKKKLLLEQSLETSSEDNGRIAGKYILCIKEISNVNF